MTEQNRADMSLAVVENERHEASLMVSETRESMIVAAQARAEVEAAYVMAYKKPRKMDDARAAILKACRTPAFAEEAMYSKPVGNANVTGLSIRAAEEAVRCMGNIRIHAVITLDDDELRKIRVTCTDLETNSSFGREFTLRKVVERRSPEGREVLGSRKNTSGKVVYIVRATDDELATKEAAEISKTIRTQGLRLVPADIKAEMEAAIVATVRNRAAEDPDAFKKKVLDGFFFDLRVKPSELEVYLGHPVDASSPAELQELRALFMAIRDGGATWQEAMEQREAERLARKEGKGVKEPEPARRPVNGAAKPAGAKSQPAADQEPERGPEAGHGSRPDTDPELDAAAGGPDESTEPEPTRRQRTSRLKPGAVSE